MSAKPTVFVIAGHMHAESLGQFTAQQTGRGPAKIETYGSILDGTKALQQKTAEQRNAIVAFAVDQRLPVYFPCENPEAEKLLGDDYRARFNDQTNRGAETVTFLQAKFKEAAGKPFYLHTVTPEYLTQKGLPQGLTAVVIPEEGKYQTRKPEDFRPA